MCFRIGKKSPTNYELQHDGVQNDCENNSSYLSSQYRSSPTMYSQTVFSSTTNDSLKSTDNPYSVPRVSSSCDAENSCDASASSSSASHTTSYSREKSDIISPIDSTSNSIENEVTDQEKKAVEKFFSGLKTQVYVCPSLTSLYKKPINSTVWELCFTGIPVVLLDLGECKSRAKRKIQLILAERGSCFMLWRDTIDNLTSYKVYNKAFHTMCWSSDHTTLIGLDFDSTYAAEEMYSHVEKLVSCPENISLSAPGKKKKTKSIKPTCLPPKNHISQPCCFQHVTSVDLHDRSKYVTMQNFLQNQ